ncbi:bifunctional diaminohydroxyphosphoribosylaminopyrimidine deaminase/5-amino-6-(5-phosphoribosylamino)uracil reductase RibD [Crenobacter intestini]|uniref:Riboflavin biosynthesis protein RibD n=1 Tax=Crenobacter intestini TaxID=2563443 RepID=A0A4T0V0U7_9NEIS|nr:bifunctional diaminohydroxyphosphoribosylaminopyrimidine deaminase/5-amino-6-(5-phosphoribosylamino)uracil reductase RibD [Crenobacter intestini]TIC85162.1 bifunctional diaminohydroxyphosphoribosylaminopyrimidine deaminase/5-amino-6-(5-phosphoribosylamino)uracil reductase RibD [Crenobacter intestini]
MTAFSANDHSFMQRALRLAALGVNTTSPNPRVGCVIVQGDEVVGEGWHRRAGEPHAEVHALAEAGARARGATAYVTLEPCSHHGRTPPCADALVRAGVSRVVAAMVDPFPEVAGRGLEKLHAAGITVESGLLADEAARLNKGFISRVSRGRPWVTLKAGASVDGRTALANGLSQWITSPEARLDVQRLRARSCAVLTGSGTVLADDPRLTVREFGTSRQPMRVVLDSALTTSPQAAIYRADAPTFLATACTDPSRHAPYLVQGVEVLALPGADGRVDLDALLSALAARGVGELMVEAGATLNGALLSAGLVDEIILYMAPMLLGADARGLFALPALQSLDDKVELSFKEVDRVGPDLRLSLTVGQRGRG